MKTTTFIYNIYSLFKFADDAKLYRIISNPTDIQLLQNDIKSLYQWSTNWLLNFSISKGKAMHVGRCHFDDYSYFMNNQPLPTVYHEKDLGVLVDGELKFHQHTAFVVAKTNRLLTIIISHLLIWILPCFPYCTSPWSDQYWSMATLFGVPSFLLIKLC